MQRLSIICLVLIPLGTLTLSGCLKTRAQIRPDEDEMQNTRPVANKVQPLDPQGGYAVDEIKTELTRLVGRLDDLERAQKQSAANPANASREDLKKLETRLAELEQSQAALVENLKKMQESPAAALAAGEPNEALDRAKKLFDAKKYQNAVDAYTAILNGTKNKGVSETAHFFRGESYFLLKQYKKAIVDFSKFPEEFQKSKRMPAALWKIGLSFEALGLKQDAVAFYQEIVDKFPKASQAKNARTKLKLPPN